MQLEGINNSLHSCSIKASEFEILQKIGIEQIRTMTNVIKESIQIKDTNHHH